MHGAQNRGALASGNGVVEQVVEVGLLYSGLLWLALVACYYYVFLGGFGVGKDGSGVIQLLRGGCVHEGQREGALCIHVVVFPLLVCVEQGVLLLEEFALFWVHREEDYGRGRVERESYSKLTVGSEWCDWLRAAEIIAVWADSLVSN